MTQFRITPLNRPVERWRDTPITPERQAESEAYQKRYNALRRQFESEWVPPPGYSAERDNEEMECIESAAFTAWLERREGRIVAVTTPVWVDALEYWLIDGPHMENDGMLAQAPTAVSLPLGFVLKGGGDMKIAFETKKVLDANFDPEPRTRMERELRLVARTEHGIFAGKLINECGERSWYVLLSPDAPQDVADRIATTIDAIQQLKLPDEYLTVMPVSNRCTFCQRPLTDIVSKTLGVGPDCARQWKIPHSVAVADTIIAKRHAFLAEEVTS